MISRVIKKTVELNKIQKVDQLEGPLYQLENAGHTFEITCLMNGAAADISGTVSGRFLRADETTVYFTGTLSGNVASITLPQSCYNVNGRFGFVVFISGSDVTTAIYAVAGSVYKSTSDTIIDPTGEIPSLEELLAEIDACEAATAAATAASAFVPNVIAPAYSASATYAVGDYVTKDNYLYQCNTAISTAEAWTAAHWTQVKVGGELSDLKSAMNAKINLIANVDNVIVSGSYSYTATSSSTWQGGYQVNKDFVLGGNEETITVVADSANGYGSQLITLVFYSDTSKTTQISRKDFTSSAFNSELTGSYNIPSGSALVNVKVCLISTDFGDHSPSSGSVAYINNLNIYFDTLQLRDDIKIPHQLIPVNQELSDIHGDITAVNDDIEDIIFDNYNVLSTLSPTTTASYYLQGDGSCKYILGYSLDRYSVTAGKLIYIRATKDSPGVYQFQKSTSVPSSLPNSNLVGTPINTAVNRIVEVPATATYLYISRKTSNTSNFVKVVQKKDISTEVLDDVFENTQNILVSGVSYSYTATSSSAWQGGYKLNQDFIAPTGATKVNVTADSANGYGSQFITLVFYSDTAKETQIGRKDFTYTFNNKLADSYSIPSGTALINVKVCLISNSFGDYTPSNGDVAYINNLAVVCDTVNLRSFVKLPQLEAIDQSAIYTLQKSWADKIQTIQTAQDGCFTFAVQTDTHFGSIGTGVYASQYADLMNNLSKLTEYVGLDFICNLGDIIRGYTTDTTADMRIALTELMHRYVTNLHCPLLMTLGNHDTNEMYATAQSDPTKQILLPELYSRIMPFVKNSTPNAVFNGRSLYYYVDFEDADIRVIVLNTVDGNITSSNIGSVYTFSTEQVTWFTNTALNTTKKVIFMCHVPLVSSLTESTMTNGSSVLNALKSFKNNGGTLIGCFYGHTHQQDSATVDGILHVVFTNGGYCTEVVMIDTTNKTISTIGIGTDTQGNAVQDRTFSYT